MLRHRRTAPAPRHRRRVIGLVLCLAMTATACSASVEITDLPEATRGERVTDEAPSVAESVATTTVLEPSATRAFEAIVDSIVFVDAGDATGTGIVIEGGWILTNAHVVERLAEVRIGRSDGFDLGVHPVFGVDWLFDVALVGPIDADSLVPFARQSSSDLAIGDDVMLIGFPDESNAAPTPTLTSGIVSRRRQPAIGDFPFLQVDATIAPGQSGGALVDLDGRLLGISGLEFGLGEFGLVFEADAMWPRIDELIAGGGDQVSLPETNAAFEIDAEIGLRRSLGFVIEVGADGAAELLAISDADVWIDVRSRSGSTFVEFPEAEDPFALPFEIGEEAAFVDELLEGGEEYQGTLPAGSYEVVVGSFSEQPTSVQISSPNELRRFIDVEEGAELPVGTVVEGVVDWSRDSDRWELPLDAGAQVTITADGIADTILAVRIDGVVVAGSDDEFIGMFGTGSQVNFIAPETGVYEVEVGTLDEARWGYLVQVEVS